jgi:murein DD-endopeptidase MepM/ murein hydrolase activator NlpD
VEGKRSWKRIKWVLLMSACGLACICLPRYLGQRFGWFREQMKEPWYEEEKRAVNSRDFIKWVDFKVSYEALCDAYQYDLESYKTETHLDWVSLLAYLGAKYGGDFQDYRSRDMADLVKKLMEEGTSIEELTEGMKYYDYYLEAYTAVLGGLVGEYKVEKPVIEGQSEEMEMETKYGLRAFSPVARDFYYTDYDDFGVSRSYGYRRQHLGHDMMGQVGTPIIAVESGTVEALGWNQYGGWRIGIRSLDQKRYYYYAHLRKGYPYQGGLEVGSKVEAGDVIGYMGRTGYSTKEDTNNIDTSHLHFGLQLIFDESQKKESDTFSGTEIWIDCYALIRFLYQNRCETKKVEGTKEWERVIQTEWVE